jgi:hypothetical protein
MLPVIRDASRTRHRLHGPVVLSVAIHLAIGAVFLQSLVMPRYLDWILTSRPRPDETTERIRYIRVVPERAPLPVAVLPSVPPAEPTAVSPPRIAAPSPTTVATEPPNAVSAAQPGDSGRGRATPGRNDREGVVLTPTRDDPRIWAVRAAPVAGEMSHAEALEGSVGRAVAARNDSAAVVGVETMRPDWEIGGRGSKVGLDNSAIHLGRLSIPSVMLGFLPIGGFGCMPTMYFPDRPVRDSVGTACITLENPTIAERARRVNEMSAEIRARAPLELEARAEISRIAARKDRERAMRLRARPNMVPP